MLGQCAHVQKAGWEKTRSKSPRSPPASPYPSRILHRRSLTGTSWRSSNVGAPVKASWSKSIDGCVCSWGRAASSLTQSAPGYTASRLLLIPHRTDGEKNSVSTAQDSTLLCTNEDIFPFLSIEETHGANNRGVTFWASVTLPTSGPYQVFLKLGNSLTRRFFSRRLTCKVNLQQDVCKTVRAGRTENEIVSLCLCVYTEAQHTFIISRAENVRSCHSLYFHNWSRDHRYY